jgi:hypothetical protein
MKRTAQDLVNELKFVLDLDYLRTGQIILNMNRGELESFETKTYARLKPRSTLEKPAEVMHNT